MNEDKKFGKVFFFIVGICSFVLLYIVAITFLPIPKDNVRFVDICLGFLTGSVLTAGVQYLLGGNPEKKKPDVPTVPGDVNTTINNNP